MEEYFTEDDAAIYVIVYEDGNMENYPAIRMMSEQMQCPAVLDDRVSVINRYYLSGMAV